MEIADIGNVVDNHTKSAETNQNHVKVNIVAALEFYRLTEVFKSCVEDANSLSFRSEIDAMLDQEKQLKKQCKALLEALASDEDETRQRLKHFSLFEPIERESVQVTAARAALSELTPALEAEANKARARAEQAQAEKDSLTEKIDSLTLKVAGIDQQLTLHQTAVDQLAKILEEKRAPLAAQLEQAEEIAKEASDWKLLESKLRGELERLEAERAALTATNKPAAFTTVAVAAAAVVVKPQQISKKIQSPLLPSSAPPRPSKRPALNGSSDDVFFW